MAESCWVYVKWLLSAGRSSVVAAAAPGTEELGRRNSVSNLTKEKNLMFGAKCCAVQLANVR